MDRDNCQEKQELKIHAVLLQTHLEVTQCVICLAVVARVWFQCGQCDAFDDGGGFVALDGLHARPTPMQQRLVGRQRRGWHWLVMQSCISHHEMQTPQNRVQLQGDTSCRLRSDSYDIWWAATVAAYCPGRMAEHLKSKSMGEDFHQRDWSPCS